MKGPVTPRAWSPSPTTWARLVAAAVLVFCVDTVAQAETAKDFCKAHPTLDAPERGMRPTDVTALEATSIHWRCMDGRALVCDGGAANGGCWKMDSALTPSADIRDFCDGNPGTDFAPMAALGNSATTWRCVGKTPAIIATQPLDARGYMKAMWLPLTPHRGPIDLPADPR